MGESHERPGFGEHAATLLATEHWSLLASRSLGYTEAFNRVSVFLTVLSASIVGLALVVNSQGFGDEFLWAALLMGPMVLFLGVTTFIRLVEINLEDGLQLISMNRLRHAYIEMAPELIPYLSTGWHDDEKGLYDSIMMGRAYVSRPALHFIVTTPTVIGVVTAFVAAAEIALIMNHLFDSAGLTTAVSAVTFLALSSLSVRSQLKAYAQFRAVEVRFPSPS
jgi:hypothetical protein